MLLDTILSVENLVKRFGGLTATDNLSFSVRTGEVHALIGPNGAGKSTLIAQLHGSLRPDEGRISFNGEDVTNLPTYRRARLGIARSFQITSIFTDLTVLANVILPVQARLGHSFHFLQPSLENSALVGPARECLKRVGLLHRANDTASDLSHGERRQLELAMALAIQPRLLLLDEPMAGMARGDSQGIVALLRELKRDYSILLVEHDMDAVFALADTITVLVAGRAIASGTPAEIKADRTVRSAYLGHS